jgi:general secretion pathway protein F
MKFSVNAIDASGALRVLSFEAESPEAAMAAARSASLRPLTARPAGGRFQFNGLPSMGRGNIDLAMLAEDLASLLEAGLPLMQAIRSVGERQRSAADRALVAGIAQRLEQGQALSEALSAAGEAISPAFVAIVRASEQTGALVDSLKRYTQAARRLQALQSRMVGAAIYPSMLALVGSGVIMFLLGFVVPRFAGLVAQGGVRATGASTLLLEFGQWLGDHRPWWMSAFVLVIAGIIALIVTPAGRQRGQALLSRLPGIGSTLRAASRSRFIRTTAMLIAGGVAAPRAMGLCQNLLDSADSVRLTNTLARINTGRAPATSLHEAGLVDALTFRILEVGERSGDFASALDRAADIAETGLNRRIDWAMKLFEPLLMMTVGTAVGVILVLMYLPIFELAGSLQ